MATATALGMDTMAVPAMPTAPVPTLITVMDRTTAATIITVTGNGSTNEKPGAMLRAFFMLGDLGVLRPERGPFHLARVVERRHEILFTFALEFFLRGTEGGDTGGDLFAFADFALFVLGHVKSPLHVSMCPTELKHCRRNHVESR